MALENSVRECCAGLNSVRATERKKSAEVLKDFLSRNAVPSLLSENAAKKKGYTWNEVFDDINEYILKETEKYESFKNFDTVVGPLCTSLLHLCVSGSNKGRAYIKCNKILSACFFILKDGRLSKAVGDAYLNVLFKYVLPCHHYLGYIAPSEWEELLDVCLDACLSKHSKLDDFAKAKLLYLVTKNGKRCCQFIVPLRDSLTKLKKIFVGVSGDKKTQEIVIEIMILLLETLSSESRLTVCEFSESMFSSILKFYDQNLDQKKKSSFFKLLRLIVTIHHPQGRLQSETSSLASDWAVWNKQLYNILEVICLEVAFLQRLRKTDDKLKYCADYYFLAASVYFQVFKFPGNTEDAVNGTSSKKQKITYNTNNSFSDLVEEFGRNHMPWLEIIHMYVKSYAGTMSLTDFISVLRTIDTLITNNNVQLNWDSLEELVCLTINNILSRYKNEIICHDSIFLSLWNSCIRTCTLMNAAHKSVHTIMRVILSMNLLKYLHIQPLIKMYFEKGMPVSDDSLKTLNVVFYKFFSKCSTYDQKLEYFNWFAQGQVTSLDFMHVRDFLLRLITSENIVSINSDTHLSNAGNMEYETLHNILFSSVDECILFSEFELDIPKRQTIQSQTPNNTEINVEVDQKINEYFNTKLLEYTEKLEASEFVLLQYIKFVGVVICYLDVKLQCKFIKRDHIQQEEVFNSLKASIQVIYSSSTNYLKRNTQTLEQNELIKSIQEILIKDYDPLLCYLIRENTNDDFLHVINNIMNREASNDDDEYEDDSEMNPNVLRYNCIRLLASYCRNTAVYRDEILQLILDPTLYNFSISWHVKSAFECIELLNQRAGDDGHLEQTFMLMQNICKELFRDSVASFKLLKILIHMLDQIWSRGSTMRENCLIMVKSYLHRTEKMYYPPEVAALIFECAAKIILLNIKHGDTNDLFMESLQKQIKGDIHSLRLYCCYLLKLVITQPSDVEIESYLEGLKDIFVIKVSERRQTILKDESLNRTLTVLHSFFAFAQTNGSMVQVIVTEIMRMIKEKSLDKILVRKILDRITKMVTLKSIDQFLNDNILSVLNNWFSENNNINQLPLFLFGFEQLDAFIEKHMKWLIAADILWNQGGVVNNCEILKKVANMSGKPVEFVVEVSICNIILLCLPYVVSEKYKLGYTGPGKLEWMKYAQKMFLSTRQLLGDEKWSGLVAEYISELVLLTATHLNDYIDAKQKFQINVLQKSKSYQYPKTVYLAILKYIGELIDENIMDYLCENQPLAIFKTLLELWKNVLQENVLELKVLRLHTYLSFIEIIPLGYSTDTFVCNYVCYNLAHAIGVSINTDELNILTKAVKIVLDRFLVEKADVIRTSVAKILSVLIIKKEEMVHDGCASLLSYLTTDMKDYLKESDDIVDFVSSISQGVVQNEICLSKNVFLDKLRMYEKSLLSPSHDTLLNMHQFLKVNKEFVNKLCDELNPKGFSDDCGTSSIHRTVHILSNILKTTSDSKTKIEACNCLAEIGNYDLKTLVTVPPVDMQIIADTKPTKHLTIVALKSLTGELFDECPTVTNGTAKTLKRILKYREGKDAMDLNEIDKKILQPFLSANCCTNAEFKLNETKFQLLFEHGNWIPLNNENHSDWLTRITVGILDVLSVPTNYLNSIRTVCLSKPSISQKLLAPLVGVLIDCSTEQHIEIISEQINIFFKYVWDLSFNDSIESSSESEQRKNTSVSFAQNHKMIVQYMLDVVNLIRLQRSHYKSFSQRITEPFNYMKLEYDKVAWAATVGDQNLAAIYYGELWAVARNDGVPPSSPEATTLLPGGDGVQKIFRKCFVSVGEMDALDGCGTAHLTNEDEKRKHLINTGQYSDALLLLDIALSYGVQTDYELQYRAVKTLHKSGMYHLALQQIKSLPESDQLNDIKYECMSFLGDWSAYVDTRDLEEKSKQANGDSYSIIKAFRYSCLKDCVKLQSTPDFQNKLVLSLNRAKVAISTLCQDLNMENCQSIYKVLSKLHLFRDIEDYSLVKFNNLSMHDLLSRWQVDNLPAYHDFKHLEALICQRSLILEHAVKTHYESLKDIVALQLQYAELCLFNQRIEMAQRLLAVVKKIQASQAVALVDSQISWAKGHKDIALSLVRNIVSEPSADVKLTAVSLRQYGLWMAESKCDNARNIIHKYLMESLNVLSKDDDVETKLKVYYDIAKFADAEYKQVVNYMSSSVFEKKVKCVENMKDTACSLRSTQQSLSKDERKALLTNDRFGQIDEAEIANTRAEKESFLCLAMRYYLLSLKFSEENNLSVFRVISLWIENPNLKLSDSEGGSFADLLHAIPSRKFITVLPQLCPRLTNEKHAFAENLKTILKRCAIEHPHHTLPIIFGLKNSDKDASAKVGVSTQRPHVQEPRVAAADALVCQLALEHHALGVIISQMEKMCDALISFANYVPKTKEQRQKIPATERIHRLGALNAIPIPTDTIPVSNDCKYTYLPTIHSFENYFELVGGINCPKKINCRNSNGKNRILLIKGEDDLRQDAVMQQVFNIVNTLLEKNPVTSRNKLLIRTYKVVPMSRRSGVLEWCEGTMPIGQYLIGNNGAHGRYRPMDIAANVARGKLVVLHEKRKSNQEKLIGFLKILKEFKPVLHFFFVEHYLDPVTWYERRLAYTKSVATSSMVGYIMGLGDRHLQNILIDKKTAEVIHIDFGIAFDQGKTLPTPETIPFRLTQDIVAGFGASGVEGIFRKCCEKTMQLLRDNQEILLTILEVLLCDPLYSWTVTSKQQNILTAPSKHTTFNQPAVGDGSLAKRALLTVSSKLSGTEGGVAGGVAVSGQVAHLIHAAMDPANLCRLFPGWQPYL